MKKLIVVLVMGLVVLNVHAASAQTKDQIIRHFSPLAGAHQGPVQKSLTLSVPVSISHPQCSLNAAVHFVSGGSSIHPDSIPTLMAWAQALMDPCLRGCVFVVEGHTDSVGSEASNLGLSSRRALAVSRFLIQLGVDRHKIWSKGYGEEWPIADNRTSYGRALNRRVVISLISGR